MLATLSIISKNPVEVNQNTSIRQIWLNTDSFRSLSLEKNNVPKPVSPEPAPSEELIPTT